ncbi:MAG: class I SAM-dependent methyltransferase [Phycisphaerae bacterium]
MTDTAVQRFYRYHAYVYDSTRWMILHGRRRAVSKMELAPDGTALEIGCGTGLNFRHVLAPLDPHRGRLVGVDFSQDMLVRAARRVAGAGWPNVELAHADATTLDLPQRFDAILFAYSLTMIPDWPAALARAYAHLKPLGRLVVLDFARFQSWGPLAPLMRAWLRANHVETQRPYVDELRRVAGNVELSYWLGGYNFTAVARRRDDAPPRT